MKFQWILPLSKKSVDEGEMSETGILVSQKVQKLAHLSKVHSANSRVFTSQWPNGAEKEKVKMIIFVGKKVGRDFCSNFRLSTGSEGSRSWSSVDSCSGKVPVANVGWRSVDQLSPWLIFLKYNLWQFWQIFTKSNQYALLKGGLDVQLTIGKLHALCNASQCLSPIFES